MFSDNQLATAVRCPIVRATRWRPHLLRAMQRHRISSRRRAAAFIAQVGHESQGLARVEENLNYSASRLREVFPSYFSAGDASQYARQRDRIANRVYANRMGNGPESSGDGWRYRGRGLIQITGRDNYAWIGQLLELDLVTTPALLLDLEYAADSAAAYWQGRGLNALADRDDILGISRRINLGTTATRRMPNGFADRVDRWSRAKAALDIA